MGNEQSRNTFTKEEMDRYQQEFIDMRNTVTHKDQYITILKNENMKLNESITDLQNKLSEALQSKQSVCENLGAIKDDRNQMYKTIADLRKLLAEKDEEMKKKVAEAKKNKKAVSSELNKYKSMAEFEAILKLNSDLVDFQGKIETVIKNNCDLLQMNDDDHEIEKIKRKNAELYGQLKNSNVKTIVMEKSGELKEAENELNMKKEIARQEFLKVNGKLMAIKEKMSQATKKFAGTVENAVGELQKNLLTYQKEVTGLEDANKKINEGLSYDKIKNILLQQQNALMTEMISSNIPGTSNNSQNPRKVHNNLNDSSKKSNNTNNPNLFTEYDKNTTHPHHNFNEKSDSDTEDNCSIFDDDASETSSISDKPRTYKIILLNVHEDGKKSDDVKVQKVLQELTNLSLDGVEVRRIGKPTGKARPIVVGFDRFEYVKEILKNRYSLKTTKFNMIRVCPYKSKPDPNKPPRRGNNPPGARKNFGNSGEKNFRRSGDDSRKNFKKGPL